MSPHCARTAFDLRLDHERGGESSTGNRDHTQLIVRNAAHDWLPANKMGGDMPDNGGRFIAKGRCPQWQKDLQDRFTEWGPEDLKFSP